MAVQIDNRYRIVRPLGAGTQGAVFLVQDTMADDRLLALKALVHGAPSHLILEFQQLAALDHRGLAQVHDLRRASVDSEQVPAGTLYFTGEFKEGSNAALHLHSSTGEKLLNPILCLCEDVAEALSHLHAHGLVHGDLKPGNILVDAQGTATRAVLVDLGLARSMGAGDARGTLPYMAPEALSGYLDARTDIYSLGATVFELLAKERMFPEDSQSDLLRKILAPERPNLRDIMPWLAAPIADLVQAMISPAPAQRPSSAAVLLSHVQRIREDMGLAPRDARPSPALGRPSFVGRRLEVEQLSSLLREVSNKRSSVGALQILGDPGVGRTRLFEEAYLRHQLVVARTQAPPLTLHRGTFDELAASTSSVDPAQILKELASEDATVICVNDDGNPKIWDLLSHSIQHSLLVVAVQPKGSAVIEASIQIDGLKRADSDSLCCVASGRTPPDSWLHGVFSLTGGSPGRVLDYLRAACVCDPDFAKSPDALTSEQGPHSAVMTQVAQLAPEATRLLGAIAIIGVPVSLAELARILESQASRQAAPLEILLGSGLVRLDSRGVRCLSESHAHAIDRGLQESLRKELHALVLERRQHLSAADRAQHLLVTGPTQQAAATCRQAIDQWIQESRYDKAWALCLESSDIMPDASKFEHAAVAAEVALAVGAYDQAAKLADEAKGSSNPALHSRACAALARCAQHQGNLDQASAEFATLVAAQPHSAQARADYSKSLLSLGQLDAAGREATVALGLEAEIGAQFTAREVLGLSALYAGDLQKAQTHFEQLLTQSPPEEPRLRGRAQGLLGMLAQKNGKLEAAMALYGDAADNSALAGAKHAAAVFHLNRATVEHRSAHYSKALRSFDAALRALLAAGTPFELAAAYCNRGTTLLALGELRSAEAQAERAEALAQTVSEPRILLFAHLLLGDVALRLDRTTDAHRHYNDAHKLAVKHKLSDAALATLRLAEVRSLQGHQDAAGAITELSADSLEQEAEIKASLARIHLNLNSPSPALAEELKSLRDRLDAGDDLDLAWRVAVLAARCHKDSKATERANDLFAKANRRCPEAYRAGLHSHPAAVALTALQTRPEAVPALSQQAKSLPLRRLLSLGRRLNSELRLGPLLDDIIDTAVDLSRAERAFLLLRAADDSLEIRVARNIGRDTLGSEAQLSRSIAEKVARTGEVVLTVDAEQDSRFGSSESISALQLRSILAVPFRVKSRIVGTLYLDHRFRRGAFDDGAVEIVRELADIAAVAIENARLIDENQRRQLEIEDLNRRLENRLEDAEAELVSARARLHERRPTGAGFASIVGESQAICELLHLAKRAAACDLPVVISGESGTGKELLARAVHNDSERRDKAFIAINCGAVPDNLLESELFGHRRGAFTGADRSRRGLFQVADKGTLFLDEIADMSLAMQSKLLRVLQEGEIRPLGAETTTQVDVRLLCASNQNLADLVKAGGFREDLFYRIHVLELHLPPLRDRSGDIEAIAKRILSKATGEFQLTTKALRKLKTHHWPGNVRELENELARATAMAETDRIEAIHLSSAIQQSLTPAAEKGSEEALPLKAQVESLERELVEQAMMQTGGNQSQAARILGLSRYGLQKKLVRYDISK